MSADVTRKKTLKLKKPPKTDAPEPAGGTGDGEAAAGGPAPVAAKPTVAVGGDRGGYKFAGTCAILAVLTLAALLIVQWMEWSYYHSDPSAFPMQTGL